MVTWMRFYSWESADIFLYDGSSVVQLSDSEFSGGLPQIHDGMVTWYGWDGNDWEIFLWGEPPAIPQLELKLSGEFDFLLKEEIRLQLAALLTDTETGASVSGATVTFDIYDPDGAILVSGILVEDSVNPGVYIYVMADTMKDLKFPKGIYLVYAHATLPNGAETVDMIQFHIDPPSEVLSDPFQSFMPLVFGVMVIVGMPIGGLSIRRYRRLLKSTPEVDE